jgi:hypothetical protein
MGLPDVGTRGNHPSGVIVSYPWPPASRWCDVARLIQLRSEDDDHIARRMLDIAIVEHVLPTLSPRVGRRRLLGVGHIDGCPGADPDKVHFWQYLRLYFALFCRELSW